MKSIRTILLLTVFGLYNLNIHSQTIVFSEDFEGATLNVTSTGTTNWSVTTSLAANGLKSDSVNIVSPNDTAVLTTSVFSTSGYSNVYLKFNHICKLEYLDGGTIEISADNGTSWTALTDTNYFGTGQFATIGNKFNSMSYGDWVPGNNNVIPDNSWWKSETFDISAIAGNSSQVLVRFVVRDGFSNGSQGAYGWLIDDIEVLAGSSELIPPTVSLQMPYIIDTVYSTGPFYILAKIEDNSGISNAIIEYTINSITDTGSMMNIAGNNWQGVIPSQPYNSTVCYRIIATDSSLTGNTTYYPTTGCITFITKKPPFIIEIGHSTVASGMAPIYITSATSPNKYSNHISLFTNSELQKPGTIKKISWVKTNLHSYNTSDAKLRIYLKHTSSSNVPITAGSFATEIANATLVYEDTTQNISAITGWYDFTFNVDTFNYNGNDNLMLLVAWYRPDSATGAITWNYTTSPGKAITFYDTAPNPGNTAALDNRPNIRIYMDPIIYQFDAGISEVVNPQSVASSASAVPFEVRIKNFGSDTLKKANINWMIDGITKTPFNWTGSLLNEMVSTPVNIGSENLPNGPHNLKVWTSLPNDSIDQYFSNDTMNFPFFMCSQILSGAYTVGGGSADFNTINDVITALNSCGVNGPVTFNINPGIYYSQILLTDSIPGLSSTNTITFTSTTNNPDDVTIKYSTNSSTNNYIIALDGADNITIKNLTIKAEGTVFSNVIYLTNSANFNVIENCRIYSIPGNSTAYGILMDGDCGNNLIQNNKVYFGQYGISASGTSSKHQLKNIISGNIVKDFERFGIYTSNNDSLKIISNIVETSATLTSSVYGIYTYGCDYSPEIIKNKVDLYLPGAGYGLYYNSCEGQSNTNRGLVANNFIIINGNSSSYFLRALSFSYSIYTDFIHNSFLLNTGSGTAATVLIEGSATAANRFFNNNIVNLNNGYAIEKSTSAGSLAITESDYNNIYTNGGLLAKWGSTVIPTSGGIPGFNSVTGLDTNSLSFDPDFYSIHDLHSYSSNLNGAGTPVLSVTDDIDGDMRNQTNPDIGADEYTISPVDAAVLTILEPLPVDTQSRTTQVKAEILNAGNDTITSLNINYILNGGTPVPYSWTGILLPGQTDTIQAAPITIPVLDFDLKVYSVHAGDTLRYNDTVQGVFYGYPLKDVSVYSFNSPVDGCDLTSNETVSVTLRNYGAGTVSSGITAYYQITGSSTVVSEAVIDSIPAGDSLVFDFASKADLSITGADSTFEFTTWVVHSQDPLQLNDTLIAHVNSLSNLPSPIVSDTTITIGTYATLTAISNDPVDWFADDTTSTILASGPNFITPVLFDTTTYYAQSNTTIPAQTIIVGTGTLTNSNYSYVGPYGGGDFGSSKQQYLYRASELQALGLTAGPIESVAFYLTVSFGSNANWDLKIGQTTINTSTTTFITGASAAYVGSFTQVTGWNTHQLQTPFIWDGTSNIFVEICNPSTQFGSNPPVRYTTTTFNSVTAVAGMVPPACSSLTGFVNVATRPNIKFVTPSTQGCTSLRTPVNVYVIPLDDDATVTHISEPQTGCGLDTSDVTIFIHNHGIDTISGGLQATYRIDTNQYITPETINAVILPGDTLTYTFATKALLPASLSGNDYIITAKVMLNGDQFPANDTLSGNTITSYYTPLTPVVSNVSVQYGTQAILTINSADTLYWYDSLTGGNLLYTGNQYITPALFDTARYYIEAQRTIPLMNYLIGQGIAINLQSQFPSPYGSLWWGAKHQFLIKASEMQSMGMIQGYIESLAFNVQTVNGSPSQGYNIQIGLSNKQSLTSFESNLTSVFSSSYYTESVGWNTHQFNAPFYWDGVSNVVIQTCFKNSTWGQTASVYQDTTSYYSSIHSYGSSSFNCNDTAVSAYHYRRPAVKFNASGYGHCISDRVPLQVNITGFPQLDAGLTQIVNPVGTAPNGTPVPVKAIIKNYGSSNLISATLNWKVNNISQPVVNWTGNLSNNQTDTVNLGNFSFDGGIENILVWVSNPNNSTDTITVNDSVNATISVCMSGSYPIGVSQPEYQTITDAVNMLLQVGICGNVTFNIDSGLYAEQVVIPYFPGSGPNATVTFTSANNDSSSVTIWGVNTQADNYVIKLDSASFVNIKNVTIAANGSFYGNAIMLINGASNIAIENNVIKSTITNVYNAVAFGIYNYSQDIHHINIKNNEFQNGYHGLKLAGSSSSRIHNIVLENNYIHDFSNAGLYLYYIDTVKVSKNLIVSGYTSAYYYGLRFHYNEAQWTINSNDIRLYPTSFGRGIEFDYSDGSSSNYGKVYNNFISLHSGTGNNVGLSLNYSDYVNIHFNSVNITGGSTASRAIYTGGNGSNIKCLNNIFAVQNQGYTAYVHTSSVITSFDHNCLFVGNPSTNYAYWSGAAANLAALKLMDLTKNINSIDIKPYFLNPTNLHTYEFGLNNTAAPITGITEDFDGDFRDPLTPDIGADEFDVIPTDIGIISLLYPTASSCGYSVNDSVVVSIRNMGSDTIFYSTDSVEIKVIVSGILPDTLTKTINTGYIVPGDYNNIVVDNSVNLSLNGQYTFEASTILASDTNSTNDAMPAVSIISYLTINTFPFTEDFESGVNYTFVEITGTQSNISVDNNANNGGQYGLHFEGGSYSGWTNYANVTQAFSNAIHVAHANTCTIDASGVTALNMKFDLKQTYSESSQPNYSWFRVMITDLYGNHYLKNVNGDSVFQAFTLNQDAFVTQIFDLSQWAGQTFNISLESANKLSYGAGNYDGDNAYVDNFSIWVPNTTDASLSSFIQPNVLFSQAGTQMPVEVTVTNFGTDTLWSIPVGYNYGNNPPVYDTLTQMLLPNATDTLTFSVPITVIQGDQPLCAYTLLPGDMIHTNDTFCFNFKGLGVFSVNYNDDFDNQDNWVATGTTNLWELGQPVATSINSAHSGTNAWVTNLSGNYITGMIDYLYSPFITIPTYADTATLEFWHWMEVLSTHAYGRIQYSLNGGTSWINLGYSNDPASTNWHNTMIAGQHYWSLTSNGWVKSSYKLSPLTFNTGNPVQFRYEFISDGNLTTYEGWAIDDFSVTIPPLADDAGILQIITPVNQTTTGDTIVVKVTIKNYGSDTLTNIPVGYYTSMASSINEIWTGTLLPDSTTIFAFSTPYVAYNQDYDICAYTAVTGDNQPSNDTLCMNIQFLAGAKDAGITAIITPSGQTTIGNDIDVKATIQNFGTDTLYNIPLEYTFNGNLVSQETFTGMLLPGSTNDFTFTTTYNSPGGIYHICVATLLNGDADKTNDTLCQAVVGTGIESHNINKFRVSQNRPNPANSLTTFTFFVPATGKVLFDLYNIMGKKMKSVELTATNGENTFTIDISSFTNGVYFSTFEYYGARIVKRIIITK